MLVALAMLACRTAVGDEGDGTFPAMLGASVYSHRFAAEGYKATDTTIAESFQLSEFVGAGALLTRHVRVGLNLQFTEAVTAPPADERFTTMAFLPQLNWNFWGPFTASFVPSLAVRLGGANQFGLALQGVLSAAVPFGRGVSGAVAIEIPVYVLPYVSIGITPLIGIVYRAAARSR